MRTGELLGGIGVVLGIPSVFFQVHVLGLQIAALAFLAAGLVVVAVRIAKLWRAETD